MYADLSADDALDDGAALLAVRLRDAPMQPPYNTMQSAHPFDGDPTPSPPSDPVPPVPAQALDT
eukprot:gene41334-9139_t